MIALSSFNFTDYIIVSGNMDVKPPVAERRSAGKRISLELSRKVESENTQKWMRSEICRRSGA